MKFYRLLAMTAAIAVAALTSCSVLEDDQYFAGGDLDGIVLRFDCGDSFDVKATTDKPGEAAYNENLLSSVEVFMYPDNGTGNDAIVHAYFTNVQTTANYNVSVTDAIVAALCPNNAEKFRIYAIANYPRIVAAVQGNATENLSNTSVPKLEAKLHSIEMTGNNVDTPQSKFLMATDGAALTDRVNPRNTTVVTTTIKLKRVAAKVSILVRVADEYEFDNTIIISGDTTVRHERWNPQLTGMKIYLVNGSKTGQVSGLPVENQVPFQYQELQFRHESGDGEIHPYTSYAPRLDNQGNKVYDENGDLIFDATTENGTFYPSTYPFYSYPKQWNYGSDDEPYLKLVIPWVRQRDDNQGISQLQKQYYYRIYCPGTPNPDGSAGEYDAEFIRNNWYKILLNVGILGSETDGGEVILTGSYYVVDWQEREKGTTQQGQAEPGVNDSDKEAEIKGARYLFVNDDFFELFNIEELSIPYITSDDCEIANVSAKKYIFSGSQKDSTSTTSPASWDIDIHLETTLTGGHIVFNHPLNNDTNGTTYDVSPYYITFTIRQRSNHNYAKTITVYQYPAIMIDLQLNSGANNYGYAYVNGCTGSNNSTYYTYSSNYGNSAATFYRSYSFYLGTAPGSGSSSNNNRNMVVIETTVLPPDSEYMLGDPRKSTIDNLQSTSWPTSTNSNTASNWSRSAASVQGGNNRYLTYYYPTDPDSKANNIISPKFRIASSWGATQPMRYADAFRRCASYQEDGYPAGRWRVPTVAEIMYIAKLNADGKIQRLLGSDDSGSTTDYWCNSGYMTVIDGSTDPPTIGTETWSNSTYKYVRCVYDDWYWENSTYPTVTKTAYRWGDVAR